MNDDVPTLASMAPQQPRKSTRVPKGPSYSMDELQAKYPSLKSLAAPVGKSAEKSWIAAFTHRPEALEGMLSDLIKQAYAKPGRIGQRPMPKEEEVNLETLLNGEYAEEPLTKVLPRLVTISERAFVAKIRISRRMYQRMYLPEGDPDKYYPDAELISRMAAAVGKPPSFFMEYRQIAAQAAFVKLITDRPVVATRLYREYLEVARSSPLAS